MQFLCRWWRRGRDGRQSFQVRCAGLCPLVPGPSWRRRASDRPARVGCSAGCGADPNARRVCVRSVHEGGSLPARLRSWRAVSEQHPCCGRIERDWRSEMPAGCGGSPDVLIGWPEPRAKLAGGRSAGGHTRSPLRGKIAFSSLRDGNAEIYVMNADGTGQTRLTQQLQRTDREPAWSPDGQQDRLRRATATATVRDLRDERRRHRADASDEQLRVTTARPPGRPTGAKIAFASARDGNDEIYVMNADGSGQTQPDATTRRRRLRPAWSPDGQKIAFTSDRDGNPEIYVMNADGSGQTRI